MQPLEVYLYILIHTDKTTASANVQNCFFVCVCVCVCARQALVDIDIIKLT